MLARALEDSTPIDKSGKSTIQDVAQKAGVSIATVSRIINEKGGVSSELDQRIRSAIRELAYVPNTVARALKAGQTMTIGLIIPAVEDPVFPPLIKVIEERAFEHGMTTILCNSEGKVELEVKYLKLLVEKQVDGIILHATGKYDEGFWIVKHNRVPFLVIGGTIEDFKTSTLTIDDFRGGYVATEHLIKKKLLRIAFLLGVIDSRTVANDRFLGYRQALVDYGIAFDSSLVYYDDGTVEGGIRATDKLLKSGSTFDACFASNDLMAMGCIDRLSRACISVPKDVSVLGYDDIPFASVFLPNLTTVHRPIQELGSLALDCVLKIINEREDRYENVVLQPSLITRASTI